MFSSSNLCFSGPRFDPGYKSRCLSCVLAPQKMASSSSEPTLDLRPGAAAAAAGTAAVFVPKTVGVLLRESSGARRREQLEEYVKRLEEERRKVDGFRRELPLCMLLISDATEALKAEVAQCGPVMEEFMPVAKRNVVEEEEEEEEDDGVKMEEKDACDKMSWMISAQLWSDTNRNSSGSSSSGIAKKMNQVAETKQTVADELNRSSAGGLFSDGCKYREGGGAFTPFKSCSALPSEVGRVERKVPVPELSLRAPPACRSVSEESGSSVTRSMSNKNNGHSTSSTANLQTSPAQASARKPRRCWSPDLHRRFISALEQLGGPYVATPKQIREIMQVDGLTNDEVKSHLQKYRLHAKRVPTSLSTSNQPVVMLGGVWVPRDPCRPSKSSISHSGSPQGPLELATASRAGSTGEDEDEKSESFPSTSAEDVTDLE